MSTGISLDRLPELAAARAAVPLALSVDDDGRARASAVRAEWPAGGGGRIVVLHVGAHTARNAQRRPLISVIWPEGRGEEMALLLDGRVTGIDLDPPPPDLARTRKPGGRLTLEVESAMLHVVRRP